ncbi:Uncharacterised protein [Acinetobacter baumannii]|nr:Uncharacterised protein [Acinetobacter baumannii]
MFSTSYSFTCYMFSASSSFRRKFSYFTCCFFCSFNGCVSSYVTSMFCCVPYSMCSIFDCIGYATNKTTWLYVDLSRCTCINARTLCKNRGRSKYTCSNDSCFHHFHCDILQRIYPFSEVFHKRNRIIAKEI